MTQQSGLVRVFTYLGAVPFLGAAVLLLSGVKELPYLGSVEPLLYSYAALIASFVAGSHWGQLIRCDSKDYTVLLASVAVVLVLWMLPSLTNRSIYPACLVGIYLLLWGLDYLLLRGNQQERAYFNLRTSITTVVVLSLLASYVPNL
jgi:hypothetical protein